MTDPALPVDQLPLSPPPLDRILPAFIEDLRASIGDDLVGVYHFGSAVSGGFDPALSDIDLLIVTARPVDAIRFEIFAGLIERLQAREPEWAGRLDVNFVGRATLADFRQPGGPFVEISHEERLALHRRSEDWLETWFLARDANRALLGPPPWEVIPPIEFDEFLEVMVVDVHNYVARVRYDWSDGKIAYRVMTLCRLLRSIETRAICSKQEGVEWGAARYPEWAWLIHAAWEVREADGRRAFTPEEASAVPRLLNVLADEVTARHAGTLPR